MIDMERFLNIASKKTQPHVPRLSAECSDVVDIELITLSNDPSTSANFNPWPYIEKYFKFIGCRRAESLEFQCLLSKPLIKILLVNRRSGFDLKKRIKNIHATSNESLLNCISAGSQLKRKLADDRNNEILTKKTPNETQFILKESLKAGLRFSETNYQTKMLQFFIATMQPLSIVETRSFQELTTNFETNLNSAHSGKVQRRERKVKALIAKTFFSIYEADAWSCRNKSYLGTTIHWIDAQTFGRKKSVLGVLNRIKSNYDHPRQWF